MELREVIYARKSVRKYNSQEVSDHIIEEIVKAGLAAPSAVNLQPWYFVVIKSIEERRKLDEIMNRVGENVKEELEQRFPAHPEVVSDTQKFIRSLGGAPVVILGFCYKPDYRNYRDEAVESVAAAMENMLLTACDQGVSGCWLTAPVQSGLSEEIQKKYAPDKGEFVGMLSIGYALSETEKSPQRKPGRFVII